MPQRNALAPASQNQLTRPAPYTAIVDLSKYDNLTSGNKDIKVDYRPLNFDALLKAGALRVTNRGLDEGYDPDPASGFSLVSAYNDAVSEKTRQWKDNPMAYDVVRKLMTERPADIGAHKYMQILQSARDLGLSDDVIYAPMRVR
jgi:hypothetical protein